MAEGAEKPNEVSGGIARQVRLPLHKAVQIAWRGIRIRWWRSLLVTSGVILALGFLTYILCGEILANTALAGTAGAASQARGVQTWWMVALALLISFVGILNAMVMSVTERFREIGTMKCLGALDGFIIKLFLLESAFQGLLGTALGIAIGLALALAEAAAGSGFGVWATADWSQMFRTLGLCFLTGCGLTMAGALYPAWRAARMQPVDAMRSEV